MTPEAMAAHVAALAREAGVEVRPHATSGRAWRRHKRIAIRPVRSIVTYVIALHELGHVLGTQRGTRLDREVQAWQWARDHAQHWNDHAETARGHALRTYVEWAEGRQSRDRRGRTFITPDHPVWRYVETRRP